jgi:hypothetical protein
MALPLIGAAAMRLLPVATRAIVKMIQSNGRSAAVRKFGQGAVKSAEEAAKKVQPVRSAARSAGEAVKRTARKATGRGDKIKRTPTGQAQQRAKDNKFVSKATAERYDRMGKRKAGKVAKKSATAVGAGVTAGSLASMATNSSEPKKTNTASGQMKKNAPKKSTATNYNVGVSQGGVPFKEAFAHFRKKGAKTFTWNGKKYTTELKK